VRTAQYTLDGMRRAPASGLAIWRPCSLVGAATAIALASTATTTFGAETKRACIDANEQGQVAQRAGRLREARDRLVSCASDACPSIVRTDCARLLTDVTAALPTVVIDARDVSGAETTAVRLSLDGVVVAQMLTGLELELDPGPHVLRFEANDGAVREQSVVLKEGEKRRPLRVDFSLGPASLAGGFATAPANPNGDASVAPQPSASVWPWVLGGVAVVGAAGFALFGILGYAKETSLASNCKPHCTGDEVSPVRTDYVASDVALGIAAVSGAAAVLWVWLGNDRSQGATRVARVGAFRFDVVPVAGGGRLLAKVAW
jgi:hypothetical protein